MLLFFCTGHQFENPTPSTIASVEDGHSCNSNSPFGERYSLRQFSAKEVSDALASIDPKTAIVADLLNARL